MTLEMIGRRDKKASLQPTPLRLSGDVANAAPRVFQGILSTAYPVAYHSPEALRGALDEEGNLLFTDDDIENQILWIANIKEICSYVPYLFSEKIRLEGQRRKEEEQDAAEERKAEQARWERERARTNNDIRQESERERERAKTLARPVLRPGKAAWRPKIF